MYVATYIDYGYSVRAYNTAIASTRTLEYAVRWFTRMHEKRWKKAVQAAWGNNPDVKAVAERIGQAIDERNADLRPMIVGDMAA